MSLLCFYIVGFTGHRKADSPNPREGGDLRSPSEQLAAEEKIDFFTATLLRAERGKENFNIEKPTTFTPVVSDKFKEENPVLEGVEENGSINQATKNMGMAYSKAWKIIKNTEKEMGVKLLERAEANTSVLTEEARKLISIYKEMQDAAVKAANEVLEARLKELDL